MREWVRRQKIHLGTLTNICISNYGQATIMIFGQNLHFLNKISQGFAPDCDDFIIMCSKDLKKNSSAINRLQSLNFWKQVLFLERTPEGPPSRLLVMSLLHGNVALINVTTSSYGQTVTMKFGQKRQRLEGITYCSPQLLMMILVCVT